ESIHGDRSQAERIKALEGFKSGEIAVLVATAVAARGLDVVGLPCGINMDLPYNAEDYVHRIGRTGRAGAKGEAIAFYTQTEARRLEDIGRLITPPVPRGALSSPSVFLARGHRPARAASGKPERYKK